MNPCRVFGILIFTTAVLFVAGSLTDRVEALSLKPMPSAVETPNPQQPAAEPGTLLLLGSGLTALGYVGARRKKPVAI